MRFSYCSASRMLVVGFTALFGVACGGHSSNPVAPSQRAANSPHPERSILQPTEAGGEGLQVKGLGQKRVDVCHRTNGITPFILIAVAAASVEKHRAHDDASPGEAVPGVPGKVFGPACELLDDVQVVTPTSSGIGIKASVMIRDTLDLTILDEETNQASDSQGAALSPLGALAEASAMAENLSGTQMTIWASGEINAWFGSASDATITFDWAAETSRILGGQWNITGTAPVHLPFFEYRFTPSRDGQLSLAYSNSGTGDTLGLTGVAILTVLGLPNTRVFFGTSGVFTAPLIGGREHLVRIHFQGVNAGGGLGTREGTGSWSFDLDIE